MDPIFDKEEFKAAFGIVEEAPVSGADIEEEEEVAWEMPTTK